MNTVIARYRQAGAGAAAAGAGTSNEGSASGSDSEREERWAELAAAPEVALPSWVSPSEQDQISTRLAGWVDGVPDAIKDLIGRSAEGLREPLHPIWLCPDNTPGWGSGLDGQGEPGSSEREVAWEDMVPMLDGGEELGFTPVVLVSASRHVGLDDHREKHSWTYIQGAGDDDEFWARGLTAKLFWEHSEEILAEYSAAVVEGMVDRLVRGAAEATKLAVASSPGAAAELPEGVWAVADTGLYVAPASVLRGNVGAANAFHTLLDLCTEPLVAALEHGSGGGDSETKQDAAPAALTCRHVHLAVKEGKRGNPKAFYEQVLLPTVARTTVEWATARLASAGDCRMCIVSDSSKSVACAMATAALLILCGGIPDRAASFDEASVAAARARSDYIERTSGRGFTAETCMEDIAAKAAAGEAVRDKDAPPATITKPGIRGTFSWLQMHVPAADVPRWMFKSLNNYFLR